MKEKHACMIHWTSAADNGLIVLFDDNTWKRYGVIYHKDYYSTEAKAKFSKFMNMVKCIHEKMTESQVDEYVQNKMQDFMAYEWGLS